MGTQLTHCFDKRKGSNNSKDGKDSNIYDPLNLKTANEEYQNTRKRE